MTTQSLNIRDIMSLPSGKRKKIYNKILEEVYECDFRPLPDWMDSFAKLDVQPKYTPITTMSRKELIESQKEVLRAKQPFYFPPPPPPPPKPEFCPCPTDFVGLMDLLLGGSK